MKVVNPNGPGGGNPVCQFSGDEKSLKKLIDDFFDDEDLYELIK